jgi:Cys-tRNA(Pro)/Cys-tRNA(Cys) deacylase
VHAKVESVLASSPAPFRVHRHADLPQPVHSPADFASQLGYDLARIAKTLLVRSIAGDRHALVVSPMGKKIDFTLLAKTLDVKRTQLASREELRSITGYPEQGVSPLGVRDVKVLIDESLFQFETILIGAGEPGVEIEINPVDLLALTGAERVPLALRS